MAARNNLLYKIFRLRYWVTAAGLLIITGILLFHRPPAERVWMPSGALRVTAAPRLADGLKTHSLLTAISRSLDYFEKLEKIPDRPPVTVGPRQVSITRLKEGLVDFQNRLMEWGLSPQLYRYVREHFIFLRPPARRGKKPLFTGYYEATLEGSRSADPDYPYPIYKTPGDLVTVDLRRFYFYDPALRIPPLVRGRLEGNTLVPYYSREEIDTLKAFNQPDLVLAWVRDPIRRFFLHIQGSGRILLTDGSVLRVNYAQANGHPYRAIGRWFIEQGILTAGEISMQSIRRYLRSHPWEMEDIFNTNPSYVFFREVPQGPLGALGVPVTPYRSIATDLRLFPRGILGFIDIPLPRFDARGEPGGERRLTCFVLNQDTGGAIKSPYRVDLFCGTGPEAEQTAGHLKTPGHLYFLIKK